jgi:hypothetical protein
VRVGRGDDFCTAEEEAAGAEVQNCRQIGGSQKRERFEWLASLASLAGPGPRTPPSMRIACGLWMVEGGGW